MCHASSALQDDFFNRLESEKGAAFISQCGSKSGRLCILLCDIKNKDWLLVEELEGDTINLADVKMTPNGLTFGETNGGIYSYQRVHNLIDELSHSGFDLLIPFTVEKLNALKPRKAKCKFEE